MEAKFTPEQFAYWLKGFIEMNPEAMITHTQWLILKDHLNLVFKKETPLRQFPNFSTPGGIGIPPMNPGLAVC